MSLFTSAPDRLCYTSIYRGDHKGIKYRGGQEPIVHLVADLRTVVNWADRNQMRWVFTDRNAGTRYFNDYTDLDDLDQIDWDAVQSTQWWERDVREKKQAEFLIERNFPWELVDEIGVYSTKQLREVHEIIGDNELRNPKITVQKAWYY